MKRMTRILTLVLALCMLFTLGAFASGEPSGQPSGEPVGIKPGTYVDGANTLVIADDMTFTMEKVGINMDGAEFAMVVKGVVENDAFVITGIFDGEFDVFSLATEDQIAADLASVEAAYAAGSASGEAAGVVPGTYTAGDHVLVIADDMTFVLEKAGENMDGAAFNLTVSGTVTVDGVFTITSLKDGDIELIEMATADQLAADLASVQAAFAG